MNEYLRQRLPQKGAIGQQFIAHRIQIFGLICEDNFQSMISAVCDVIDSHTSFHVRCSTTRYNGDEDVWILR